METTMKQKFPLSAIAVFYVPAALVILLTAAAAIYLDIPPGVMTRDIATLVKVHPLTGFVSNLGIILWCAAASISTFAAVEAHSRSDNRQAMFLGCFAALTTVLMLDDLFLLHEYLGPIYLGLRERYLMLVYAGLTGGLLIAFRKEIISSEYPLLGLAFLFFAFSVGMDRIHYAQNPRSWLFLVEDGTKFIGIAGWLAYFVRHSHRVIALEKPAAAQMDFSFDGLHPAAAPARPWRTAKLRKGASRSSRLGN